MGQKVNPNGFRFGITKKHLSNWMPSEKLDFGRNLIQDQKIYKFFEPLTRNLQIGKITISRQQNKKITITLEVAKPGLVIGQNGENLKQLSQKLLKYLKNKNLNIQMEILELAKPETNAKLIAEQIAIRIENRQSFRIAQKVAIRLALQSGVKGIKTLVSGRLNGVDMARSEGYKEGEMKLQTLRQKVDYGVATARTTYGAIGVKVWVSHGEMLNIKDKFSRKNNSKLDFERKKNVTA